MHEQPADSVEHAREQSKTRFCWVVNYLADYSSFDFLWEPVPWQSHQRHAWASQWQKDSGTYLVPKDGYTDTNYHSSPVIKRFPDINGWTIPVDIEDFDYSWHPDPTEFPYIYVFGTKYYEEGGPVYHSPGAKDYKYVSNPKATLTKDSSKWKQLHDIAEFDWSWKPHPRDPAYIYVFGNQWYRAETMPTLEYHVPGATERKFMQIPAVLPQSCTTHWHAVVDCEWDYSWVPDPGDPPYIYVFGNQWHRAEIMPTMEYHVPGATERKFMPFPKAKLLPDESFWTVPDNIDRSDIDFSWVPDPGSPPYIYQFATQHQKTGGPRYTVPGATEITYLEQIRVKSTGKATAIYEIDHMDGNTGKIPNTTRCVRYFDNYKDTLIRLAKSIGPEHEFVWVCSSVCDYTDFDFSWYPEQWQAGMLHVFASDGEKFGDTFFMHVPSFAYRAERCELLEWYDVNFVKGISVSRHLLPLIEHNFDSHVDAVPKFNWVGPLAIFSTRGRPDIPTVPLWREQTKTIVPLDTAAEAVIIPRPAIPYIKTQLYDYPHINKTHRKLQSGQTQDIVFISYDEPDADANWQALANRYPQARRVHGVKGMEQALEAAADVATTPWYFAVFAKTLVNPDFDFSFVPDRMQQPKHYVFDCLNTVNDLQYGHMGIVMYNSQGIRSLNRSGDFGLDYTLSFLHESVPLLSCFGNFNTTPYHTWRTAFRETAKLCYFEQKSPSVEGSYRLDTWLKKAHGEHAEWCLNGAADGQSFFNDTQGDLAKLKDSFRWEWLREYFVSRYGDLD